MKSREKLNSNIRCIEMNLIVDVEDGSYLLNSNIRCIEMKFYEVSTSDEQVE